MIVSPVEYPSTPSLRRFRRSPKTPPPSLSFVKRQNPLQVFDVLSRVLRRNRDEQFWWDKTGSVVAAMFDYLGYTVELQYRYMLFYHSCVLPFMGTGPIAGSKSPAFRSYMTDDHTPIEASWVIDVDGNATVRYAIEPIATVHTGQHAALVMIDSLTPIIPGIDLTWFRVLNQHLVWDAPLSAKVAHASQYFVGFDCGVGGAITLKAYFLPEVRSACTGISKEELVRNALSALGPGLLEPWNLVTSFFDTLPAAIRPSIQIVATDCGSVKQSRIKVYVRTRSTKFSDLVRFMTLDGGLNSPQVEKSLKILSRLWNLVLGVDTRKAGWEDTPLRSTRETDTHLTSGLLLYYELTPGSPHPFPKVYLPVRHYCQNDLQIARGMASYHLEMGNDLAARRYVRDVSAIFANHRSLSSRTGIHTYVSCAIKQKDVEVTSYFNPEAYAPERRR